jgi:nucleoside 2-deoxyribosyltransferase
MAMPYDDATLDGVFAECFKPAVKATGFDLIRLDDAPPAGLIDDRLRVEIRRARFLIADLTGANRGAYWEAGFAEGLGKPVIYTCEKGHFESDGTHFDTSHHHTVLWTAGALDCAAEALKTTIRATLPAEAIMRDGVSEGEK